MSETYLAVSMSDGSVIHMAFQTLFRSPFGTIEREANDANLEFEIARLERSTAQQGRQVVTWRRITDAEHKFFEQDRDYRDALTFVNDTISHDIDKAKGIRQDMLRVERSAAIVDLDGQWMKAIGTKDQAAADAIEAQRQVWRDAPADPRIDAAKTIDDLKAITIEGVAIGPAIPVSPVKAG